MTHILVLTVGGSPAPLIYCISRIRPDRTVFLCSQGSITSIDEILNAVPIQGFDRQRDVVVLQQRMGRKQGEDVINALDRLDLVYLQARDLLDRLRRERPAARLTADYTGGTKTMAAGLALAAIDDGDVELLLTTNERREPGQIAIQGHSTPLPVAQGSVHARRLLATELPPLLKRFDYAAALVSVTRVRRLGLPDQEAALLIRLETLLHAFEAWDRFDHREAAVLLASCPGEPAINIYLLELKRVVHSRQRLDPEATAWPSMPGHGLEAVQDLLLNASRRAGQQRYDDAVGRLYRAAELTAQLLLKQGFDLLTEAIAIERLPVDLQPAYRQKHALKGMDTPLQLGLVDSFDLLASLEDPAGLRWRERRHQLTDQLRLRNMSLFAHGFQPIGYAGWRQLDSTLGGFLSEAIAEVAARHRSSYAPLQQLPSSLADLAMEAFSG